MSATRSSNQALPDRAEALAPLAVLGLRDTWLLAAVRAAIGASGFAVADVAVSTAGLLQVTAERRPRLVVAALDVLGAEPARTIQRALVGSPGTTVVVLSELDAVPVWLLEAGAEAVVAQAEIAELKWVLRGLRDR